MNLARSFVTFPRVKQYAGLSLIKHFSASSGKELINGVNLFYEKTGSSEQAVLCIPGALGATRSDFGPQLDGLQKDFTVVAFDPRGYGKSIPPQRDFPKDFYSRDADDAAELMVKLGYTKFDVLGWSDGGISGVILAARRPELVRKMVVWGSNLYVSDKDIALVEQARDISKWNPKMKKPLVDMYGEVGLHRMWNDWMDRYVSFHNKDGGNICIEDARKVKCPLLVIHGQKDPLVAAFHPEFTHKNVSGSKLHLMPEGRHNLHLRFSQEFNNLVTQFLKEDS